MRLVGLGGLTTPVGPDVPTPLADTTPPGSPGTPTLVPLGGVKVGLLTFAISSNLIPVAAATFASASSLLNLPSGATGSVGGTPSSVAAPSAGGKDAGLDSLRPNAKFVAPLATPPPIPPLSPELRKRSKFCLVKNSLLLSTNFSAAAEDISCTASVEPSVAKPVSTPLPARLYQAPISSFSVSPIPLALRNRASGVIASNTELNPPNNNAAPRSSLPVSWATF